MMVAPRNGIEAREGQDGETRLGRNDESPVGGADAPELLRRISTLTAEVEELRAHIAEQITHVETRIQDGIEMGATVWRIALEDVARENRATLTKGDGDKLP